MLRRFRSDVVVMSEISETCFSGQDMQTGKVVSMLTEKLFIFAFI